MKIAYLTANFGLISETFIKDLALGITAQNQTVKIICNQNFSLNSDRLDIEEINFLGLDSIFSKVFFRINNLCGNPRKINNYKIKIEQANKSLLPGLKKYQPDVAYIDFGTVAALVCSTLESLSIPFVVHFHGADITSSLNDLAYREKLQQVFNSASAIIVASKHIRRLLVLEGASPDKIHLVRLGINLEGLTPISWKERKLLPPSVVFLGRLTPKKHPVALIEAFALVKQQVANAHLSIIGDGTEMPRVQQRIEKLKLKDSVKLYGALPRDKALPIVNQHWVFAQHSVTANTGDQEGFGISLAEAAALELPIVSTLHNGIPEQVIDGKTGLLVKEFDYESMAECIIKLLTNPDLAEQMGYVGNKHITKLCQTQERNNKVYKILTSVFHSS
jgi:glycosyltransferase involved in cell wall biosynthesis